MLLEDVAIDKSVPFGSVCYFWGFGCAWPIYVKAMHSTAPIWKLTKRSPISSSIDLSRMLRMVVKSKCTGPLSGGLCSGALLESADFVLR